MIHLFDPLTKTMAEDTLFDVALDLPEINDNTETKYEDKTEDKTEHTSITNEDQHIINLAFAGFKSIAKPHVKPLAKPLAIFPPISEQVSSSPPTIPKDIKCILYIMCLAGSIAESYILGSQVDALDSCYFNTWFCLLCLNVSHYITCISFIVKFCIGKSNTADFFSKVYQYLFGISSSMQTNYYIVFWLSVCFLGNYSRCNNSDSLRYFSLSILLMCEFIAAWIMVSARIIYILAITMCKTRK